ncbi:MAG: mandelate racemase/muconate lactonizing enzyme family protein [Gemmatimonadetes bacterium]|jgi:muconate cycloisomerase|nr:mandelate racemase/muconate lactonizing enzyme family protein [Gemmatimonadota bacterium]MBT6147407.1 mandelate racemase/muconate lactonizing enzyme family protein [Gemmatimonadota bacterium]MBT7859296.1 mandelate racemase/muconate lactonizing enzyme family protein [Gemmatimonadota bacterium]
MKITRIDITRVHVPQRTMPGDQPVETPNDGYVATAGLDKHIIRMRTDVGITGLGETWKGTPDAAVDAAARALIGLDPTRLSLLHLPLPYDDEIVNARDKGTLVAVAPVAHNPSIHAFEVAIADIVGQAHGVPICQLLGGAVRDRVLVHYWSGRRPPEELAQVALAAKEQGFSGIKIKCVLEDPNVERVQAIHAACGPDFRITLDPNQRFHTIQDTLALAEALDGYPIELFEDPLPKASGFHDYVKLRERMNIPVGLHLERPEDVLEAIRLGAADIFNLRGTMSTVNRLGYLAETAGIHIWRGSGLDLGILDASYAHVCAATPSCTLGSDIVGQFAREDDLILEPLVYEDSHVMVPQGPGLGVDLDEEALDRYTVSQGDNGGPAHWSTT